MVQPASVKLLTSAKSPRHIEPTRHYTYLGLPYFTEYAQDAQGRGHSTSLRESVWGQWLERVEEWVRQVVSGSPHSTRERKSVYLNELRGL